MRAVYVAIVLGFLRRLLRRVLSPAGRLRGDTGEQYKYLYLYLYGRGYSIYLHGPWKVPMGEWHDLYGIVSRYNEGMPRDIHFGMVCDKPDQPVGGLELYCRDIGIGDDTRLVSRISANVMNCCDELDGELGRQAQ